MIIKIFFFFFQLKRIRALATYAQQNQCEEELLVSMKVLNSSMPMQIRDLRSQIVREACITVAYLSTVLRNRMDHFAEIVLSPLINLIQSSAKVMTTSGIVAIRFIIDHTHSVRLIPIVVNSLSSKSKEIRRHCCEFINQLLSAWDTHHLDKHVSAFSTAIKKGITDADQEARVFARKAFWSFHSHFPTQANNLLESLDLKTQKLLQSGASGNFGSIKSLKDANLNDTKTSSRIGSSISNLLPQRSI